MPPSVLQGLRLLCSDLWIFQRVAVDLVESRLPPARPIVPRGRRPPIDGHRTTGAHNQRQCRSHLKLRRGNVGPEGELALKSTIPHWDTIRRICLPQRTRYSCHSKRLAKGRPETSHRDQSLQKQTAPASKEEGEEGSPPAGSQAVWMNPQHTHYPAVACRSYPPKGGWVRLPPL